MQAVQPSLTKFLAHFPRFQTAPAYELKHIPGPPLAGFTHWYEDLAGVTYQTKQLSCTKLLKYRIVSSFGQMQ